MTQPVKGVSIKDGGNDHSENVSMTVSPLSPSVSGSKKGEKRPMNKKLTETILYLLNKCGPMTKEKLENLLYFIDFNYYEKYEKPFFKGIKWIRGKRHPELKLSNPPQEGKVK
jgi:hypothetical protein